MPWQRSRRSASRRSPSICRCRLSDAISAGIISRHASMISSESTVALTQIPGVINTSSELGGRALGRCCTTVANASFISLSLVRFKVASGPPSLRSMRIDNSTFPRTSFSVISCRSAGSERLTTSGSLRVKSRKRLLTDLHSSDRFHSPTATLWLANPVML